MRHMSGLGEGAQNRSEVQRKSMKGIKPEFLHVFTITSIQAGPVTLETHFV